MKLTLKNRQKYMAHQTHLLAFPWQAQIKANKWKDL
jgi:hypothetical protein